MTEQVDNGSDSLRPRVPMWIAVVSVAIALISASGLVYLLYEETKGPGEILREFARRVDKGECEGSYELLDETVQAEVGQDPWCSNLLPLFDEGIDSDFDLEQAVLEGDTARLEISGVPITDWELSRFGERSWRVVGPAGGLPMSSAAGVSS